MSETRRTFPIRPQIQPILNCGIGSGRWYTCWRALQITSYKNSYMENKTASVLTRRQFLRQAACAALGTAAMTSAIRDLRFMNAAVAQTNISDYKALVCIFLNGGNDSNNLIIPTIQGEFDNYAAIRTPVLAIPQFIFVTITTV